MRASERPIYIYFASGRHEAIAATWALYFPPNTNSRGSVIPGPATTATPCGADQLDFEEVPWPEVAKQPLGRLEVVWTRLCRRHQRADASALSV